MIKLVAATLGSFSPLILSAYVEDLEPVYDDYGVDDDYSM